MSHHKPVGLTAQPIVNVYATRRIKSHLPYQTSMRQWNTRTVWYVFLLLLNTRLIHDYLPGLLLTWIVHSNLNNPSSLLPSIVYYSRAPCVLRTLWNIKFIISEKTLPEIELMSYWVSVHLFHLTSTTFLAKRKCILFTIFRQSALFSLPMELIHVLSFLSRLSPTKSQQSQYNCKNRRPR